MARRNTRERILDAALRLFNDEGESSVTTVDIANELSISPGNLYYHFKGKSELIDELYARFHAHMSAFLEAPIEHPLEVKDNWFYLYVLFEEIYRYRFFYRNLTDLLHRYPHIRRPFRRLLALKQHTALSVLHTLRSEGALQIEEDAMPALANQMAMTLTYFLNYEQVMESDLPGTALMHKGVYQIMGLVAPYFGEQQQSFYQEVTAFYNRLLHEAMGAMA